MTNPSRYQLIGGPFDGIYLPIPLPEVAANQVVIGYRGCLTLYEDKSSGGIGIVDYFVLVFFPEVPDSNRPEFKEAIEMLHDSSASHNELLAMLKTARKR